MTILQLFSSYDNGNVIQKAIQKKPFLNYMSQGFGFITQPILPTFTFFHVGTVFMGKYLFSLCLKRTITYALKFTKDSRENSVLI